MSEINKMVLMSDMHRLEFLRLWEVTVITILRRDSKHQSRHEGDATVTTNKQTTRKGNSTYANMWSEKAPIGCMPIIEFNSVYSSPMASGVTTVTSQSLGYSDLRIANTSTISFISDIPVTYVLHTSFVSSLIIMIPHTSYNLILSS